MIAVVPGNFLEELIQGGGHVGYRRSILFGQVFLLKDEAGQGRAQEFNGWLVELAGKDLGIEIGWVVLVLITPSQLRGGNHLGNLEEKGVPIPQMLLIGLEGLEGLGGLAVLISEGTVEGEVDFQDREVLEILGDAVYREDFFNEGMFPHHLGALPDAALIAFLGIDLSQPAGIPVTGRAHLDLGMEVAEVEFLNVCLRVMGHDPSLNQKGDGMHLQITRSYPRFLKVR